MASRPVGTVKDITAWREYFEKLRTQVAANEHLCENEKDLVNMYRK